MIYYLHHYQTEEHQQNDDVSVMLNYFRMSNEKLILDYTRLLILSFITCLRSD